MGYKWDISNIILMEDSWDTPRGKQKHAIRLEGEPHVSNSIPLDHFPRETMGFVTLQEALNGKTIVCFLI